MLEQVLFSEWVHGAAAGLDAVQDVEASDDPNQMNVAVLDFLPGSEEKPWIIEVKRSDDFAHPLFGERYPCIELSLALMAIPPHMPGYLDLVAANAAPCLDHQRFSFNAHATWDPDTGQLALYSQVRLREQAQHTLVAELGDRLRDMTALAYLISFRIWQLQLRRELPPEATDPVVQKAHERMLGLLGATPPTA